jgi:hypothetical protein
MAEFRLVINTDNEAFTEDPDNWTGDTAKRNAEVARILRYVADRVEYNTTGPTVDVNGNTVGSFGFFAEVAGQEAHVD